MQLRLVSFGHRHGPPVGCCGGVAPVVCDIRSVPNVPDAVRRDSCGLQPSLACGARRDGSAAVVNVGSVAGLTAVNSGAIYGATKAAMKQLTKSLACEWATHGIRVRVRVATAARGARDARRARGHTSGRACTFHCR